MPRGISKIAVPSSPGSVSRLTVLGRLKGVVGTMILGSGGVGGGLVGLAGGRVGLAAGRVGLADRFDKLDE